MSVICTWIKFDPVIFPALNTIRNTVQCKIIALPGALVLQYTHDGTVGLHLNYAYKYQ